MWFSLVEISQVVTTRIEQNFRRILLQLHSLLVESGNCVSWLVLFVVVVFENLHDGLLTLPAPHVVQDHFCFQFVVGRVEAVVHSHADVVKLLLELYAVVCLQLTALTYQD